MPAAVRTVGLGSSPADIAKVLNEDGCVVIADLASRRTMDQIRAELEQHLTTTSGGNTDFLGEATRRTGALIARSPTARSLITHPTIIDTLDLALGDHASTFQIDLTQLVTIGPGEPAQMIHRDQWSFDRYQFPRGFEAEVATMWAVTDFTEEMGATRMVVGSHQWEDDPDDVDFALSSPAVMTKGSVLMYTGSVFHGGGANTTETSRIGMNVGYSLGWLRQEENQYLACPPEIARTLPEGLLRLMGYQRGSYSIGYVDDMREPLDWLHGRSAHISDFYAYRRVARKRLKAPGTYVPPIGTPIRTSKFNHRGNEESVIQEQIRDVLVAHGRMAADPRQVDYQANLYDLGLTSHASVDVMLALEDAFDIEFPDEVLKKSTFASIGNIEQVVQGLVKAVA